MPMLLGFTSRLLGALLVLLALSAPALASAVNLSCWGALLSGARLAPAGRGIQMTGALAKTESGIVLATGDYVLTDHKSLVFEIQSKYGPIKHYYWAGEISVGSVWDAPDLRRILEVLPGPISAVNPTSGHREAWEGAKPEDSIQAFRIFLERILPRFATAETQWIRPDYRERNLDREHIDPHRHELAKYVRHEARNDLYVLSLSLELLERVGGDPERLKAFWERDRPRNLVSIVNLHEALQFLVRDGYIAPLAAEDEEVIGRARAVARWADFRTWELSELRALLNAFSHFPRPEAGRPTIRTMLFGAPQ